MVLAGSAGAETTRRPGNGTSRPSRRHVGHESVTFGSASASPDGVTISAGEVDGVSTYDVQLVDLEPQRAAVVRAHVAAPELPALLGAAFGEVIHVLSDQHLAPAGPPFGRFTPSDGGFDVEAGFPCNGVVREQGRVSAIELPGGPAARVLHRGDYGGVAVAYQAATEWLAAEGYAQTERPWESYLDGPEAVDPRTVVHVPCRRQ